MDARLQRRIQRYGWDLASGDYEHGWRTQLRPAQDLMLQLAALRPGERVLDVACGTGIVSLAAARAVAPDGRVVGVDLAEAMVDAAIARACPGDAVEFQRMDAEALSFADASFDVVLSALGLMYVPDPAAALREQYRVLQPGGRAAAAVWGARDRCGWQAIFGIVDRRVRSEVCPLFFRLGTGPTLAREFAAAGFVEVRSERLATELVYADDEHALVAAFRGGPVALANHRFDGATRAAAEDEYLASIAPFRHGGGYRIPGEFVVVVGGKPAGGDRDPGGRG
ncbi:MAG: methyltransferase domain-containing protein [Planctomycetes bacterium]|nr:methyltransferase domain-containing protein [Planctomycetota bacterium]